MAGAGPAIIVRRATAAQAEGAQIAPGPFRGTRESLKDYQVPNWYRDAKFGIWAHWGPESAPEFGDWYAQRMYIEGNPTYKYHLENYGHPSKFGYKDICRPGKTRRAGRRRLTDAGGAGHPCVPLRRKEPPRSHAPARGFYNQGLRAVRLRHGLAGEGSYHPSFGGQEQAGGVKSKRYRLDV